MLHLLVLRHWLGLHGLQLLWELLLHLLRVLILELLPWTRAGCLHLALLTWAWAGRLHLALCHLVLGHWDCHPSLRDTLRLCTLPGLLRHGWKKRLALASWALERHRATWPLPRPDTHQDVARFHVV